MPAPSMALLAADTDRTQEYVFESSRLPEIRGASRLLHNLNKRSIPLVKKAGGSVIVAAGGILLAQVPEAKAGELAREIEGQYLQESLTATTTVAWRTLEDGLLDPKSPEHIPFGSLMRWAGTWLRRQKDGREQVPWLDCPPFAERCSSCNIRPVSLADSLPGRPLCAVCRTKNEAADRFSWFDELKIAPPDQAVWEPHDLSEIGAASSGHPGYIGFIYLDGDNMGDVFDSIETKEEATWLSDIIEEAALGAVKEALSAYPLAQAVFPSQGRKKTRQEPQSVDLDSQGRLPVYPFEILTIGGDDIMLIVPADRAIPMACAISQGFQSRMEAALAASDLPQRIKKRPFTLSGGVVLADDHNPVRALRDLSRELKSSAKKARYKSKSDAGYLDFIALMGTDMPDRSLEKSRQLYPYLIEQPGFRPISLLGRPYPVTNLGQAWDELANLRRKNFPNSQMASLAENLTRGVQESGLFYKYQRERLGNFEHLDLAIRILQESPTQTNIDPWQVLKPPKKLAASTVLWDLAELYSLVPG